MGMMRPTVRSVHKAATVGRGGSLNDLYAAKGLMQRFDYDAIDSTNDQAQRLLAEHGGQAFLVTAAVQTAGRGRHGRTWQSPRGGAWMSLAWPMTLDAHCYAAVPLVAALATKHTIHEVTAGTSTSARLVDDLTIKWPNDLLLSGRKVAGILCQRTLTPAPKPATAPGLIIGVGINVDFDCEQLTGELRSPATTLRKALGVNIAVEAVIQSFAATAPGLLRRFEQHQGLTTQMLAELRQHLALVDDHVTVTTGQGRISGSVIGLDEQGSLLLKTDAGTLTCQSGEIY
jgi:BirA family biotin operon repressor/biotin-[acetyl-CoA-carboxylase] ligase